MTPERIERVLADFRAWLLEFARPEPIPDPPAETTDLHALAGHLIALRQDVNLQTRASRTALEQNAALLRHLEEQMQAGEEVEEETPGNERLKPLLKALMEVHDALALARTQVERLRDSIRPALNAALNAARFEAPPGIPTSAAHDVRQPGFLAPPVRGEAKHGRGGRVASPLAG